MAHETEQPASASSSAEPVETWLVFEPRRRWEPAFLVGLALLLVILLIPRLGRVPRVLGDEQWAEAMAGYTIAFEGRSRNIGIKGWGGAEEYFIQPRLFPAVMVAPVYRAFGYGVDRSRAVSAAFGVLLVFGVYGATRRMLGPVAAAGAAALTSIDPWFFVAARQFRPEIFLAALLWGALFCLLGGLRHGGWRGPLAAGALIGLAAWTHPNAVVFAIACFVALTIVSEKRGRWLMLAGRASIGLAVGLAPFLIYVAYVQYVSDVTFMGQLETPSWSAEGWAGRGAGGSVMAAAYTEWQRWRGFLRLPMRAPLALFYLVAAVIVWRRGGRAGRLCVLVIVASALVFPFVIVAQTPRYLIPLIPFLAAMTWRALPWPRAGVAASRPLRPATPIAWRPLATVAILAMYVALTLGPTVLVAKAHWDADFDQVTRRVGDAIPQGVRVLANHSLWSALRGRDYVSTLPPNVAPWTDADQAEEFVLRWRPEYAVQASHDFEATGGIDDRPRDLNATPMGRAIGRVASRLPSRIVTEFYDPHYGAIRVWELDWTDERAGVQPKAP